MFKGESHLDVRSVLCELDDFCKNGLYYWETELGRLDATKVGRNSVGCVGVLRDFKNCLVVEEI